MSDSPSLLRSLLGKLLFIVGVLILLALLAWAVLKIVPKIASSIAGVGGAVSGIFASSEVTATLSPQTVSTGEVSTLKWKHGGQKAGEYSLSYDCVEGVSVTMEKGGTAKALMCDNEYTLDDEAGEVALTPKLTKKDALADVDFRVIFRDEDGKKVGEDRALLTVTSGDGYSGADSGSEAATEGTVETSGSTGSTGSSSTGSTSYSAGTPADIALYNPAENNGRLTFTAGNTGGKSTGVWYFTYSTPTNPQDVFVSPAMSPLAPGEALGITLRFGEVESGNHTVTVSADPYNQISESTKSNNSFAIRVNGGSSNNGNSGNDDANFEISDLEAGYESGNRFREDESIDEGDEAAIRFTVENTGDESTGSWRYRVLDPDGDWQRSSRQDSLRPGEEQEIVVTFGEIDSGSYTIKVDIDPDDDVDEEDEGDNDDSVKLKVTN
jgi:hypothetical protein